MLAIPGYKIKEQLYESNNSIVFRANEELSKKPVVLKILNQDYPSPGQITKFKREYEMTKNLNIDGVIKIHNLEKYKNTFFLVIEDFGGESLNRVIKEMAHFDKSKLGDSERIKGFLHLAIQVVKILGEVHKAHIIHKDISPSNIVWNRNTGVVKLIDFGISTALSREIQSVLNPSVLEGTLQYMSPEQTGRMNRAMDYRTDFYSLGISFYELLTGKRPFTSKDAMELVHSHIAKTPIAPIDHMHDIGLKGNLQTSVLILSKIIMKLLSKTAEERYQSSAGLVYDLEWCLNPEVADDFQIGTHDISEKFRIPQKLYGRNLEISILHNLFQIACIGDGASMQYALVSGSSGIGKTSLIHEIRKPIVAEKGYFIEGKYDKFKRNIPYRAIVQAFHDLTKQILCESQEKILHWKKEILDAVGANGKVITDVIPELEAVIGEQSSVMELGPMETQNRFHLVFQNFFGVFCKEEHPIVIFLDDLQWADLPSIQWIKSILTGSFQFIFLVFSYRSNEIDLVHPFSLMLEEVEKAGREGTSFDLKPLKEKDVAELVADTLKQPVESVKELASILHFKTEGNPFFVNELFTSFYRDEFVYYKSSESGWSWDISKIKSAKISDNVIEHMVRRIHTLDENKIKLLKLAACVGNIFYLEVFLKLNDTSEIETLVNIQDLSNEGYFQFSKEEIRFVHDKILESVYTLVDEKEKVTNHYKIGKLFLELADMGIYNLEDRIFSVVNQLNQGISLMNEEERSRLTELNTIAGDKAVASSAYESGLLYFTTAQSLLPKNYWEVNYNKSLSINTKLARLQYLNRNYEKAEELFDRIIGKVKTDLEKVNVYEIKMLMYVAKFQFREALDIGVGALEILGVTFPEVADPSIEFTKVFELLGNRKPEELINLPMSTETHQFAVMRLLTSCIIPAFVSMPSLFPLVVGKMVITSLQHGNFPLSPIGYAWFGNIMASKKEKFEMGYEFGKLAIDIIEKFNISFVKSTVYWVFYTGIDHWKNHTETAIIPLLSGFNVGLAFGDLAFASYCVNFVNYLNFYNRKNLEYVDSKFGEYANALQKIKQQDALLQYNLNWQTVINLSGKSENYLLIEGERFNEIEILPNIKQANNFMALFLYNLNKAILFYFSGDMLNAYNHCRDAIQFEGAMFGLMSIPEHTFFFSITCVALLGYSNSIEEDKKIYLSQIKKNQERMKVWAENCPANYGHKYYIVEGALADRNGDDWKAIQDFRKAIELAKEHEYTLEEAIANELFADFWFKRGEEGYAKVNLVNAHYSYRKWGCKPKVKLMEEKYSFLAKVSRENKSNIITKTSVTESLDLESILKVSHAISGEIVLETLLKKMIQLLIENAGAERGFLLLQEGGKWKIEATGSANDKEGKVLESILLESQTTEDNLVSPAIVRYVEKTKKPLVLEDATQSGNFTRDSYILKNKPNSILCAPILHQGRLMGIIYLENNLSTGAFTPDRLEIIELLSSQTAISLENARLYTSLEEKVEERTIQLKQAHEKILILEKENTEKQLAGGFAHEIRNALAGPKILIQHILGEDRISFSESTNNRNNQKLLDIYNLIKEKVPQDTLKECLIAMKEIFGNLEDLDKNLKVVYNSISKGLMITQLIMDYAKLGNEKIGKNKINLNNFIKNLVEEYQKEWLELSIFFRLDFTHENPNIQGLETHFESIFKNLLLNAKDALLDKNRTSSKEREIEIKTHVIRNEFITEIKDNGIGIEQKNIEKIYETFFSTKPDTGTGLGLGVVKKIVKLYNGKISVESELGKGTSFKIAFPLQNSN